MPRVECAGKLKSPWRMCLRVVMHLPRQSTLRGTMQHLRQLKENLLIETTPPWYSPIQPKPVYENNQVKAYWDVPVYAYNTEVRANRVDARFVDKGSKIVTVVEMTCPWTENRHENNQEKTQKYDALRWELKQQYPGFEIRQVNLIVDVLGGYSENIGRSVRELLGVKRGREVLR